MTNQMTSTEMYVEMSICFLKIETVMHGSSRSKEYLVRLLLLLVIAFQSALCLEIEIKDRKDLICLATENVDDFVSFSNAITIDFLSEHNSANVRKTLDCMKSVSESHIVTVSTQQALKASTKFGEKRKKDFVLIAFQSVAGLLNIIETITPNNFNIHGYFLFIATSNLTAKNDLDEVFRQLWKKYIYNVNIMVETAESVSMFTFFPFSQSRRCHNTEAELINQFIDGRWKNSSVFPLKLKNFHQCKLRAGTHDYNPSAIANFHSNGSVFYTGSDVAILNGLAERLNFGLSIEMSTEFGGWGQVVNYLLCLNVLIKFKFFRSGQTARRLAHLKKLSTASSTSSDASTTLRICGVKSCNFRVPTIVLI